MPRQGLGHSSVDIYNMVTPGTDDPVWKHPGAGQLMMGYQQTRSNFVLFSQDATDTEAWTKQNTAIDSTLYEAPDNSTTANAIKSNTTGSKNYYLQQQSLSITAGKTYTVSVHLKKGNLGFGWLRAGDGTTNYSAVFNLNTGAVTNTSQVLSTSVDAMDDDWFRCSITFQAQNTSSSGDVIVFAQIDATDNTPNVAVSGIVLLYVWGWQLEENSEMSAYIVTTNSARTTTETLNDTSETWDFDSADLMPEADPDDDGVWEVPANVVLNGDYEELGSELVTNGDFSETTTVGWSNSYQAPFVVENNMLKTTALSTGSAIEYTINGLTIGSTYKIEWDYIVGTGASPKWRVLDSDQSAIRTYTDSSSLYYFIPTATTVRFSPLYQCGTAGTFYFDNVSIKQVDPNDRWSLTNTTISDGVLNFPDNSSAAKFAIHSNTSMMDVGSTYEITLNVSKTAGGVLKVLSGTGGSVLTPDVSISSSGTHTFTATNNTNGGALFLYTTAGENFQGTVDNVTVREYAIQPQDV